MFDTINFSLFTFASWILIITPGPDLIYVITRGISLGRKAGIISALGVTVGILFHTLFAAFGLSIILRTSSLAFMGVKFIGAIYLVYLGVKAIHDKNSINLNKHTIDQNWQTLFLQGVLSNVLNPKVALFFLAFLPQFVSSEVGNITIQIITLGIIFAIFGVVFLLIVGYFSGSIGIFLSGKKSIINKIRWLTGSILILLGLRIAFIEQK